MSPAPAQGPSPLVDSGPSPSKTREREEAQERETASLLVVGCGNMGAAIISGASRHLKYLRIIGFDPHPSDLQRRLASEPNVEIIADGAVIPTIRADAVVLAVKPQVVHQVLAEFDQCLTKSLVISVVAGLPLRTLTDNVSGDGRFVRAMPNLACAVGAGMTVGFGGAAVPANDRGFVEELFRAVGDFAWLETEAQIDVATAISGSGPGFTLAFGELLAWSACQLGLPPELATQLARQTLIGTGALLARDSRSLSALKAAVTSPGGTTQAGLAVLEGPGGLSSCVRGATQAAHARAVELGAPPQGGPPPRKARERVER